MKLGRVTQSGFTLIELLVALTIFAIMSAGIFTIFNSFQTVKDVTDRDSKRLYEYQKAFNVISRDITQMIPRPIKDEFGSDQPALKGEENIIEFTRAGWNKPKFIKTKRSELQRVKYVVEEGDLQRIYWDVLDRADNTEPKQFVVLEGIDEVKFRYYRKTELKEIKEEFNWPNESLNTLNNNLGNGQQPQSSCGLGDRANVELPLIVEITIIGQDFGEISKKYLIPVDYADAFFDKC